MQAVRDARVKLSGMHPHHRVSFAAWLLAFPLSFLALAQREPSELDPEWKCRFVVATGACVFTTAFCVVTWPFPLCRHWSAFSATGGAAVVATAWTEAVFTLFRADEDDALVPLPGVVGVLLAGVVAVYAFVLALKFMVEVQWAATQWCSCGIPGYHPPTLLPTGGRELPPLENRRPARAFRIRQTQAPTTRAT
jgi:hypothetical protein